MKAKLGIILGLLCIASFLIYNKKDIKKTKQLEKEILVSGKIIDATDEQPIQGATIAIQGTNPQSLSDAGGQYAIMARGDQELVFKHPKYRTIVIEAKDAKAIKMKPVDSDFTKRTEENIKNAK